MSNRELCLCGSNDFEEFAGEVNHTTECVTDLFSFVDVEWRFLRFNLNYLDGNG